MDKCEVIAISNQKGGVGKTTTAFSLGVALANQGKKVLLVDTDSQSDLTTYMGWHDQDNIPLTLADLMRQSIMDEDINVESSILHHNENVDLIPANLDLSALEVSLVNAMDMTEGYGDGVNPVINKSEFILSLFEQLDKKGLGAKEKSIIDRCTAQVYNSNIKENSKPTLADLREKLLEQPEQEAKELALSLEMFANGSLNIFAHETNVDTTNRIISYNIYKLGKHLKTIGLLVITDAMLNRVTENFKKGKRTHIFIDEIHVLFQNEYSATFFNSAWRQFRKRNAYPTAITQNVEYLLASVEASTMLSNSEFIVMLNQATQDRKKLAELLNISDEQLSYITNSDAGCGLIRYGSSLVPFINKFPKDTKLYKLMTTKPWE